MSKEEKIYYSDLTTLVDVCFSCKSQNIIHYNIETFNSKDSSFSVCGDCNSQDVGAVFPKDLI